ncbi:MAG: leucine-rich repeat protein [Oscillospiraceae bacterium]|nr:leucine-rich repeat protein [Oscillospiraceae bacterium]
MSMMNMIRVCAVLGAGMTVCTGTVTAPLPVSCAVCAAETVTGGSCGKDAVWTLDSDGTLTVSGTGKMYGLNSQYAIPWAEEKDSIRQVVIGKGITNVGGQCFSECRNLTSVSLSDTVTSIDESAFSNCVSLTSVNIPDSVSNIATFAFVSCKSLKDITFPPSVASIGSLAFSGTPWLKDAAAQSPYVTINGLLIYGPDTAEAVIPAGVTTVVSNSFYGRTGIRKLTIPDTVTVIEYNSFVGCSGLECVEIPDSVTELGMQAFAQCTALAEVTVLNPDCRIFSRANTFANDSKTYSGVIKGYDGSTAEAYAAQYGYQFESLGPAPLRGDVSRNGEIGADDAQMTLKAYVNMLADKESGLTDIQLKVADVDGDGAVTATDAQMILKYYVNTLAGKEVTWEQLLPKKE